MCVMGAVAVPLGVEGVAGEDEAVDMVVVADVDVVVIFQMKLYHSLPPCIMCCFVYYQETEKTALQESHQGLL